MTSQQLRTYIGRVLGKSLRLILPSLWWRKLFEAVADRVDEVEGLIATSFEKYEKEHPSISSRTLYWTIDSESEEAKHNVGLISKILWDLIASLISERKVEHTLYLAIPSMGAGLPLYEIISSEWTLASSANIVFVNVSIPCESVRVRYNITFSGETGTVAVEEAGSSSITVDSSMSSTSTNPVQNKAVKAYVDDAVSKISVPEISVDSELSESSENPVQNKVIAAAIGDINSILDSINGEVV